MPVDPADWQRRFRAAPAVWAVFDRDGCLTNLYDSESAAMFEIHASPREKRGPTRMNIHDSRLASERWAPVAATREDTKR